MCFQNHAMRTFYFILFCSFSFLGYSQKIARDEIIHFWNTNIQAIINLDKSTITDQTNFPVEGSWGYAIDLSNSPDEWTKFDFLDNLELIFSEERRLFLRSKTFNDLIHHTNEEGEIVLILNLDSTKKDLESGQTVESSIILFFKKFNSNWKLFMIEYVGA